MTETARWLAENGVGGPVDYFANGPLLRRRQAEREDHQARVAEARRQVQLEEERDQRLTAMYLSGVQPGAQIARAQAIQEVESQIGGLQEQLTKLTRRRDRLVAEGRDQAEAVATATRMVAGPAPADGIEGAAVRAQAALREVAREGDVLRRARRMQEQRRPLATRSRPFGSGAVASANGHRPPPPETYEELRSLPQGASSRGGCPPCDGCGFVICKCGQDPGAWRSGTYSQPLGQLVSRVTEGAMVSVR